MHNKSWLLDMSHRCNLTETEPNDCASHHFIFISWICTETPPHINNNSALRNLPCETSHRKLWKRSQKWNLIHFRQSDSPAEYQSICVHYMRKFSPCFSWLGLKPQEISSSIIENMPSGIFYDRTTYIIIQGILTGFKLKPKYKCRKYLNAFTDGWNKWFC